MNALQRMGIVALTIMFVCISACDRPSKEEKELSQKMIHFGLDVPSSELEKIKKPSTLFNFPLGLSYLSKRKYDKAQEAFAKLVKKYPKSKVALYYEGLAKMGIKHDVPLPQLVYDFYEQLYQLKETNYSYKNDKGSPVALVRADPMYKAFVGGYLLKGKTPNYPGFYEIPDYQPALNAWFEGLKTKTPYDYIIYASLVDGLENRVRVIEDGMRAYPDSIALKKRAFSFYNNSNYKQPASKARALLDALKPDAYYFLAGIALLCKEDEMGWRRGWEMELRPPLCKKQLDALEKADWNSFLAGGFDENEKIRAYFLEKILPQLNIDFDSLTLSSLVGYGYSSMLEILSLSGRIISSAYTAYEEKDYDRALRYLSWNKSAYKAVSEKDHVSLLSRMIQLHIAQDTWSGMIETMKAMPHDDPEALKKLERFHAKIKDTLTFYVEYLKAGPFIYTAGMPRTLPYEIFIANRPLWIDTAFVK